jgi:hypothetical protein
MYVYGRTVRWFGGLRLVAIPVSEGLDCYFVTHDDGGVVGGFTEIEAAIARFEALRRADPARPESLEADTPAVVGGSFPGRRPLPTGGGEIIDLDEYRQRRRR